MRRTQNCKTMDQSLSKKYKIILTTKTLKSSILSSRQRRNSLLMTFSIILQSTNKSTKTTIFVKNGSMTYGKPLETKNGNLDPTTP